MRALPAQAREHDVLNEDLARLSPLKHANLNVYGKFDLDMSTRLDLGPRLGAAPFDDEPTVTDAIDAGHPTSG